MLGQLAVEPDQIQGGGGVQSLCFLIFFSLKKACVVFLLQRLELFVMLYYFFIVSLAKYPCVATGKTKSMYS